MPEGITPDNTYRIKIGEEIVDISPSTNDHGVRYSERFGFSGWTLLSWIVLMLIFYDYYKK